MKNLVIFLHTEHCIWIANKNVMDVIKIFDMVFLEHEQNHAMSAFFCKFFHYKGKCLLTKKYFQEIVYYFNEGDIYVLMKMSTFDDL